MSAEVYAHSRRDLPIDKWQTLQDSRILKLEDLIYGTALHYSRSG